MRLHPESPGSIASSGNACVRSPPTPERLEESYEAWVAMAERAIRRLEAAGMLIERVPVDAEELIAWCKDRARPIDSSARAEFAARQLRKIHLSE